MGVVYPSFLWNSHFSQHVGGIDLLGKARSVEPKAVNGYCTRIVITLAYRQNIGLSGKCHNGHSEKSK